MSLFEVTLLTMFLFMISGVIGYLFSRLTKMRSYMPSAFMVTLPIYIILGFQILIFSLTVIGLLTIGISTMFVIVIVTSFLCLAFLYFDVKNRPLLVTLKSFIRSQFLSIENIAPLFLFSTVFWFFLNKMAEMRWPPVGDVANGHGPFVSTLLYNSRLTLSLKPLAPWSIYYPPGFHVFAANIASWFSLLPGEAILLLAGSTIILIFWLMYSLTYIYTHSKLLSVAVFLSPFVYHPSGHLSKWIVGFLYNGTYPSLLAILLVTFSIAILALLDSHVKRNEGLVLGITSWQLITMLTLLLVYPPFLPLVMLTLIYLLFRHRSMYCSIIIKNSKMIIVLLIVILLVLSFGLIYFKDQANVLFSRVWRYYTRSPKEGEWFRRKISFNYFYDHLTGFAMVIAFPVSFLFLLSKKYTSISFMYFLSFILLVLSLINPATLGTDIFRRIVHNRFHMIPWLTSWTMIALGIYESTNRLNIANKELIISIVARFDSFISEKKINIYLRSIVFSLCFFALTALFMPSIIYQYERNPNWYTARPSWPHDYEGLLWIHNNIPSSDLILNDYSWAGLWILSFSFKNTTSNFFNSLHNLNRTLELNQIWKGKMPAYKVYDLLKRYNVSYIFTTSEWGYLRWETPLSPFQYIGFAGRVEYVRKPLAPSQYIKLFSSYPFLKLRFQRGNTAIYEVNLNGTYIPLEGSALSFDGVDDYVHIHRDMRTINELTASIWIKSDVETDVTSNCFIFKATGGTTLARWILSFHDGNRIVFTLHNGTTSSSISYVGIQRNVWTHIVVVFKADERQEIWVNGELVASRAPAFAGGFDTDRDIQLGAKGWWGTNNIYYKGLLDEVRVYNRALTQEEIQRLYERQSLSNITGLVMELLFDEGKGNIAYDTSGNLNHGTIHGATYTAYQIMLWTDEP